MHGARPGTQAVPTGHRRRRLLANAAWWMGDRPRSPGRAIMMTIGHHLVNELGRNCAPPRRVGSETCPEPGVEDPEFFENDEYVRKASVALGVAGAAPLRPSFAQVTVIDPIMAASSSIAVPMAATPTTHPAITAEATDGRIRHGAARRSIIAILVAVGTAQLGACQSVLPSCARRIAAELTEGRIRDGRSSRTVVTQAARFAAGRFPFRKEVRRARRHSSHCEP